MKQKLLELAEQHGISTTRRHFFERRGRNGDWETTFIDLPRSRDDLERELLEMGILKVDS